MILHITSQKSSFLLKKLSGEPRYGLRRLLRSPLSLFLRTLRYLKPPPVYVTGAGGWDEMPPF
jgi:hypothetical protein